MRAYRIGAISILALLYPLVFLLSSPAAQSLKENNEVLFEELQRIHGLSEGQMDSIRTIFRESGYIGQGNPAITRHPMTPQACQEKLDRLAVRYENSEFEKICKAKYMAPLYNPATEKARDAKACIDQFEFPDIPCVYPVVWVRAREAALICRAMGKRLCDAHEWEGACAGALEPPDYRFDLAKGISPNVAIARMREAHNAKYGAHKVWAYGDHYQKGICASSSFKTFGCNGGSWTGCGSNTFPSGSFPDCHSALGVYDQHGNAAEHMNLPLNESQMASRGSKELGYTEMKGSWFIFDTTYAHQDWCRWRAPFWHGSRVMDLHSHENYHLGFRCCKTIRED
ncbi:MAG TPA: SUMF1/EgtB/PvdO family nonheme iron enzyme [Thermodesulfobacteriota bacterium]|nr:SUMF1/EgtB/PvdO family nonheme iron enzyme [Thermodesulfobacteriota bacterium]